ncbi:hypothetical protein [Thermococcus sp. JCM 11816]|uniref:hypothetical protein n=1 Tax=Thermococcus sp. (strain JCM 11816 / KS-1) TaxID=1295125 RepID=UPI000A5E09E2
MNILLGTSLRTVLLLVFAYIHLRTKRKSALFLGIALLLSGAVDYAAYSGDPTLFGLIVGVVGTTIITALNLLLDEENIDTMMPLTMKMASYLLPICSSVLGALSLEVGLGSPTGGAVSYPYALTGITLALAGFLIIEFLGRRYGWRTYLFGGASIVLLGIGAVGIAVMIGNRRVLIVEPSDLATLTAPTIMTLVYALLVLPGGMIEKAPRGGQYSPPRSHHSPEGRREEPKGLSRAGLHEKAPLRSRMENLLDNSCWKGRDEHIPDRAP